MRLKDSFAGVRVILFSHDVPPIAARRRHNVTIGVDPVMRDFYAVTRVAARDQAIRPIAATGDRSRCRSEGLSAEIHRASTSGAAALTTREGMFAVCGPRGLPIGMVPQGVNARS